MSNIAYQSGNHAQAVAIGAPRYEEPLLPDYNGILVMRQDYQQDLPVYSQSLNTTYPGDGITPAQGDFYLVDESAREDCGGYAVRWTRTWARVPYSHVKPLGVYYYSYPGIASSATRDRALPAQPVWGYLQRDFYLVGSGGSYADFESLVTAKLIRAQAYYIAPNVYDTLQGENLVLDTTTSPTEADYLYMVNNNQTIVPEDSKIYRWLGNIFAVDTIYIPAR